jgi:hypothetical protein
MIVQNEQIIDDLTNFLLKYELKMNPELLRNKLRFFHQKTSPGPIKSKIRGILNMFTRWGAQKIITDIFEILQKSELNKTRNLSIIKPDLLSREFMLRINTGEIENIFVKRENEINLQIKQEQY